MIQEVKLANLLSKEMMDLIMPKKMEECVEKVNQAIRGGKIPKTYKDSSGKMKKSNAWGICTCAIYGKGKCALHGKKY